MKTAFLIGLWLSICSFTCSNTHAMDNLFKNISGLVAEAHTDKTAVEAALGVKLTEDKTASAKQGMKIYVLGMDNPLSTYSGVELRLFNGNSRYLLLIHPKEALLLKLEELKKMYHYTGFTASDKRRQEAAGYHFEKNGHKIHFYCDEQLKHINYITVEGAAQ